MKTEYKVIDNSDRTMKLSNSKEKTKKRKPFT